MRRAVLLALALLALSAAPASAAPSTGVVTMDDGVQLAYDLYEPSGAAPAGGWPAIVVMHGLGGSKDDMAQIAQFFADHGYAALAYSARGEGTSGGDLGLAGPREVADLQAMAAWVEARPEVSDAAPGCWGISYGGGQCWNAAPAGTFGAIDVVETWTDLYSALWPGNVARSGIVAGFAHAVEARSPLIRQYETDSIQSLNLGAVKTLVDARSVSSQLASVKTPVYMFQGRVDYAFDIAQAVNGFDGLAGPKRLYVGDFGHPPSTFPGPDVDYVLAQSLAWYDRFLEGMPNGIDKGPDVTLSDRTGARRTSFAGLPKTRAVAVTFGGTATTRSGPRLQQALETFGSSTLRVQVRSVSSYPRLVAVVTAGGKVVTHGAVVPHVGADTIRLADYAQYVPKGTRLSVRFGPDGGSVDLAYLGFGATGSIALGPASLTLQTLTRPVSG